MQKHDTKKKLDSYVYAYYDKDKIVYVGIGSGETYERAQQLSTHESVAKRYKAEDLDIRILTEGVSAKTARALEGLLIRTLRPLNTLLNVFNGSNTSLISNDLKTLKYEALVLPMTNELYIRKGCSRALMNSSCPLRKFELMKKVAAKNLSPKDFPSVSETKALKMIAALYDLKKRNEEGREIFRYQYVSNVAQKAEAGKKGGREGGLNKRKYSEEDGLAIHKERNRIMISVKRGKDMSRDQENLKVMKAKAVSRYENFKRMSI